LSSVLSSSFFLLSSCLSLFFFLFLHTNQWRFDSPPLCDFLEGAIYSAYFLGYFCLEIFPSSFLQP
jgi:hypothetical protein